MSLWLTILKRILEEKAVPGADNVGSKIRKLLYGSLSGRVDLDIADSILMHVFGRDFRDQEEEEEEEQQMRADIGTHLDSMGLANTESQSMRIISLLRNVRNRSSTILCAPTMTGKMILLKVCL